MSNIDNTYHKLLKTILNNGFKYEDPNRKGVNRIQIPDYKIVHDFKNGFPAITTKKLYWKGIVGELLWFLKGDTNIKYLIDNNINIWNKDAYNWYIECCDRDGFKKLSFKDFEKELKNEGIIHYDKPYNYELGDLGRVYGAQWRNWKGIKSFSDNSKIPLSVDQICNLIKRLKETPMGTKHIVTAWNPVELNDMALSPCHWSFEILVEPTEDTQNGVSYSGGIIDFSKEPGKSYTETWKKPKYSFILKWHQRSVDTFLGLPFNIASYALLAHIIGKLTNMIPKGIIGDLSNVHIYEPHTDAVREQLSRDVDKYSNCELDAFNGFKMDMHGDIDQWLLSKEINDFNLVNYKSYPSIKAEMLSYNK